MNLPSLPFRLVLVCLSTALILAACGGNSAAATPTLAVEQIQTEAVATFASGLTSTAASLPTQTPAPSETPTMAVSGTVGATATQAPPPASANAAPTCLGLAFVSDVTIPDNTKLTPGEKFTKTWRVRNSGSCSWESGFTLRFTGGQAMGGSSVVLEDAVEPGKETNLSVDMTAPAGSGSYRGNWRMTNKSGAYFGDEVYVLITVGNATATATSKATASVTPTSSLTPTATETATETSEP